MTPHSSLQSIVVDPGQEPAAVVTARDVVRRYGEGDTTVDALRGVSVDIAEGRLTAVMGPSGSGKSTLMHILAGLDQPTSGQVTVAGVDITGMGDSELTLLRRDHIGFIFQFFNLLPMLTAAENIALPLKLAGGKPDPGWLDELVRTVGLEDRLGHRPSQLSGGQQQRVAVARALVARPSVMFADEPTGNLDSTTSGEILGLLRDSVDTLGQTTVMVTHDASAAAIADRILFLADGDIVRDLGPSSSHDILSHARGGELPMIGVALKGLAGRKVRALLTALAVVIGVSMVAGTFVLTDTMQKSFNGLFSASLDKTDAVIGGKEIVQGSTNGSGVTVPAGLVEEIRALPEVEAAGGTVAPDEVNGADIIGDDGKAVAKESLGMSYDAANARFSPLRLKTGDWPQGADQVVIDAGTAAKEDLGAGDEVVIATGGERAQLPDLRYGRLRRRGLARLRQHRRVGPRDRAARARPRGPLRHRLDRREVRHVAGRARRRGRAARARSSSRSRTAPSRRRTTRRRSTRA